MKRTSKILILIACVVLGVASLASAAGGTTKVKSKVTVSFKGGGNDPYGQSAFTGKVKGKNGCGKKRKVSIKGVGKAKTSKGGKYSISASNGTSGTYTVKVKKRTIKAKDGSKISCSKAKAKIKV